MHLLTCVGALTSALLLSPAGANVYRLRRPRRGPSPLLETEADIQPAGSSGDLDKKPPTYYTGTFQQLIDHRNPAAGTFSQRYWYNPEWWAGSGAPVVLKAPGSGGEDSARYTQSATQAGQFAREIRGAAISLEHRYKGQSSPFQNLTVINMQPLNLYNSLQDVIYFAKNVKFPFDPERTSAPDKAPWVLTGCSESGGTAAFVQQLYPGTFWAYHASSPVMQFFSEFWQYYVPIKAGMPRNCSNDVQAVVKHIDQVLSSTDEAAKYALKKKFGLERLSIHGDFATVISQPMATYWQDILFCKTKWKNPFWEFCDYVENVFPETKNPQLPGPEGVGAEKALEGYGRWIREKLIPGDCASWGYGWTDRHTTDCYQSVPENPVYHANYVDNYVDFQDTWVSCNDPTEMWSVSAPGDTGLVSKFIDLEYARLICKLFWPRQGKYTYGLNEGRTVDATNKWTGGWNVGNNNKRIMWVVGQIDPWRGATPLADDRPGGPLKSTPDSPVYVIPGASHCSDAFFVNVEANPGLGKMYKDMMVTMKRWVKEYYTERGMKPPPESS